MGGEKINMKNIVDFNIVESVASGTIAFFFGNWDFLLKSILVLVILDVITGWIKAICNHNLSSDVGFKGVLKKIVIFIIIVLANIIQSLLYNGIVI